jgi:hypothetical protein
MRAILVLLATLAFVAAPAVTPPFMGYDPATFPVRIDRPAIQPAGYAFSIWGVIYLWLLVHAAFGLMRRQDAAWQRVRWPNLGALVLGTAWLAIAGSYPVTATVTIIAMAGFTLVAFLAADPKADRWLLQAPLALFAGWLTAASMVSLGVVLAGHGWLTNTGAALAMLGAVIAVAGWVQWRRPGMPVYSVSVIWAALGVAVVNWADLRGVALAAMAGAAVQGAIALWGLARR